MDQLWSRAESGSGGVTVREVNESLSEERELAYTTVMTVLTRLAAKGLVSQERTGRAYRYAASATREQFAAAMMREPLGALDHADRQAAILQFLDEASAEELDAVRAALALVESRQ